MKNKHKHLDYIQNTITRLASTATSFKMIAITLTMIMMIFVNDSFVFTANIAYIILLWYLDAFYLKQERMYRRLYSEVLTTSEEHINFSMNSNKFKNVESLISAFLAKYMVFTYIPLIAMMILHLIAKV